VPVLFERIEGEVLEVAIAGLVESHQNRHNLAQAQAAPPHSPVRTTIEQTALPPRVELLAEVIDVAKQVF
jgi:hypothetical protein